MTDKQQAFADHYTDPPSPGLGNATKSAELAGYSKNSARQQGSALLSNPAIKAAIAQRQKRASEDAAFSRAQAITELLDMSKRYEERAHGGSATRVELEALELACRIAGHLDQPDPNGVGAGVYAYIGTPPPGVTTPEGRNTIEAGEAFSRGRTRLDHPNALPPSR